MHFEGVYTGPVATQRHDRRAVSIDNNSGFEVPLLGADPDGLAGCFHSKHRGDTMCVQNFRREAVGAPTTKLTRANGIIAVRCMAPPCEWLITTSGATAERILGSLRSWSRLLRRRGKWLLRDDSPAQRADAYQVRCRPDRLANGKSPRFPLVSVGLPVFQRRFPVLPVREFRRQSIVA